MDWEDLPPEAQNAFIEVANEYAKAAVNPNTRQKYVKGLENALENNSYAFGLSEKFNIPATEFSGVEEKWVKSLNTREYVIGMSNVGFTEELAKRYAEAITS